MEIWSLYTHIYTHVYTHVHQNSHVIQFHHYSTLFAFRYVPINIWRLKFESFFLSFSGTAGSWEKRKRGRRRGPWLLMARLFEASLSGLAAASCVSKPCLAFYPLCCPRCVKCTELLCGKQRRHIAFCLLSPVGGKGGWKGDTRETKSQLTEGRALQSTVAQRLMKRYFMQSCARCNCGVPKDRESHPTPCPTPQYLERATAKRRQCHREWKFAALWLTINNCVNKLSFRAPLQISPLADSKRWFHASSL